MTDQTNDQKPDTVEIESMDQFIFLLSNWHQDKVNMLKQMMEIPQGFEVSVDDQEAVPLVGDLHRGFKIGLIVALSELGQLPFVAEMNEETPATSDEQQTH